MAVKALQEGYHGEFKDSVDKFGGAIVVYIGWDKHLWFCSAKAFPLDPNMPFGAVVENVLPVAFGAHPQFAEIEWEKVEWSLNQEPFTPDMEKTLADQGFDHKSLLRMKTPGLNGLHGASI